LEEAKVILKQITSSIPETAYGVERMMLIGDLISRLSLEERVLIKRLFDSFLIKMSETTASDIDVGGFGSQGRIWYRIFGNNT
jgi:twitching motility protein PilT